MDIERLKRSLKILKTKGLLTEETKIKIFGEDYETDEQAQELLGEVYKD